MKNQLKFMLILIIPSIIIGQTKIGNTLYGEVGDIFGNDIRLSGNGNTIAVAAPWSNLDSGQIRLFSNVDGEWASLEGGILVDHPEIVSHRSKVDISLDGTTIAVRTPIPFDTTNKPTGQVQIYKKIERVWRQIGNAIDAKTGNVTFGEAISLSGDGNVIAISDTKGANGRGEVFIYSNIEGEWVLFGDAISGYRGVAEMGQVLSLSYDGKTIAIGTTFNYDENNQYTHSGEVAIFRNVDGVWSQIGASLQGEAKLDFFGSSISLSSDGNTVAIGAPQNDGADRTKIDSGQVKVYKNEGGTWVQLGETVYGDAGGDSFGCSVSLSSAGDVFAVGASQSDGVDGTKNNSGLVKVYKNVAGRWLQLGETIYGDAAGHNLGYRVSLSGDGNTYAMSSINSFDRSLKSSVQVFQVSSVTPVGIQLSLKVYLQGACFNTQPESLMRDDLRQSSLIPSTSPYEDAKQIDKAIMDIEGNNAMVDWVFVELRNEDNTELILRSSAILQRDGHVILNAEDLASIKDGSYNLALYHRNHLGIITANAITMAQGETTTVDFTRDIALVAGGENAMIKIDEGVFAMVSGDFDSNGQIQNEDLNAVISFLGIFGYNNADMDMNGQVQNIDVNSITNQNLGRGKQFSNLISQIRFLYKKI